MADIRLSAAAESDIVDILQHSHSEFGLDGALRYEHIIATALNALAEDCFRHGVRRRFEIAADICSYHLRYSRDRARHASGVVRRPRHLILFRSLSPVLLGIGRLLHDSMELERHLPDEF